MRRFRPSASMIVVLVALVMGAGTAAAQSYPRPHYRIRRLTHATAVRYAVRYAEWDGGVGRKMVAVRCSLAHPGATCAAQFCGARGGTMVTLVLHLRVRHERIRVRARPPGLWIGVVCQTARIWHFANDAPRSLGWWVLSYESPGVPVPVPSA